MASKEARPERIGIPSTHRYTMESYITPGRNMNDKKLRRLTSHPSQKKSLV